MRSLWILVHNQNLHIIVHVMSNGECFLVQFLHFHSIFTDNPRMHVLYQFNSTPELHVGTFPQLQKQSYIGFSCSIWNRCSDVEFDLYAYDKP